MRRALRSAFVAALVWAGAASAQTVDSCKLTEPPKDALRKTLPGGMVDIKYPDPAKVPSNYTGCLNSWFSASGPPAFIAKFRNGVTESVISPITGLVCEYRNGQLVPDPRRLGTCLEAQDVTLAKWRLP